MGIHQIKRQQKLIDFLFFISKSLHRLQNLAIRCTLLSVELLKSSQLYTEGARQFIRMTSTDADLMSGLLLEQSAYLFLKANPRQFRKYAFHVVLAGHR